MMMEINITLIGTIIGVLVGLTTLLAFVRRSFAAGTRENTDAILSLRDTCESLNRRVLKMENELLHLPNSKETNDLSQKVVRVEAVLEANTKELQGFVHSMRRVEKFLFEKRY